jgi:hypothetical protein
VFELNLFKPEVFNHTLDFSKEAIVLLQKNINKFKEAMKIDDSSEFYEDNKIKTILTVKETMANYRKIVNQQSENINKVIVKSKDFKFADEM